MSIDALGESEIEKLWLEEAARRARFPQMRSSPLRGRASGDPGRQLPRGRAAAAAAE